MMRSEFDWGYVRRHTLIPVVCLLIAGVLLAGAVMARGSYERQYRGLLAGHSSVYADYDALVDRRQVVDAYRQRYRGFVELGFVGNERRLDWVETLRTTSEELALPRLSYSIEPQRHFAPPVASVSGRNGIQIRGSVVQLSVGLYHELELLQFFDRLQQHAPGLISVDKCELQTDGDARDSLTRPGLSAMCTARIYSVTNTEAMHGSGS